MPLRRAAASHFHFCVLTPREPLLLVVPVAPWLNRQETPPRHPSPSLLRLVSPNTSAGVKIEVSHPATQPSQSPAAPTLLWSLLYGLDACLLSWGFSLPEAPLYQTAEETLALGPSLYGVGPAWFGLDTGTGKIAGRGRGRLSRLLG